MNVPKNSMALISLLVLLCSSQLYCLLTLEPDTLVLKQTLKFGGNVESVSWCCEDNDKFAAVAGNPCNTGAPYVYVYELDANGLLNTTPFAELRLGENNFNFNLVYSVDWCCSEDPELLAVGGSFSTLSCANDGGVSIYSKGASQLDFMATYTHGGRINSVAWLCGFCDDSHNPVVAIAGEAGDCGAGDEIRILEFDPGNDTFNQIASFPHGAPINSLDWCYRSGSSRAYLAAGGENNDCSGPNLRIYVLTCESGSAFGVDVVTSSVTTGSDLHAVRWCCDESSKYPRLAVGGKPGVNNINTHIYCLYNNRLVKFAEHAIPDSQTPGKIFTIDWNPLCKCSHLTYGIGCLDTCEDNIFVYKILRQNGTAILDLVTSNNYDDHIKSLEWCWDAKGAYLLVGSSPDIECLETNKEIALYKAAFCNPQTVAICSRTY